LFKTLTELSTEETRYGHALTHLTPQERLEVDSYALVKFTEMTNPNDREQAMTVLLSVINARLNLKQEPGVMTDPRRLGASSRGPVSSGSGSSLVEAIRPEYLAALDSIARLVKAASNHRDESIYIVDEILKMGRGDGLIAGLIDARTLKDMTGPESPVWHMEEWARKRVVPQDGQIPAPPPPQPAPAGSFLSGVMRGVKMTGLASLSGNSDAAPLDVAPHRAAQPPKLPAGELLLSPGTLVNKDDVESEARARLRHLESLVNAPQPGRQAEAPQTLVEAVSTLQNAIQTFEKIETTRRWLIGAKEHTQDSRIDSLVTECDDLREEADIAKASALAKRNELQTRLIQRLKSNLDPASRRSLDVLITRLAVSRSERDLPAPLVLESLLVALAPETPASVTGQQQSAQAPGPDQAPAPAPAPAPTPATVLKAINRLTWRNLVPDVGDEDGIKRDRQSALPLLALFLESARGIDTLKRLLGDSRTVSEGHDEATLVYVRAGAARIDAATREDQAWLDNAVERAKHIVNRENGEPTNEQLAAYNGVRNGLTSIGTGTTHDLMNALLEKFRSWVIHKSGESQSSTSLKRPLARKPMGMAVGQLVRLGAMPSRTQAYLDALSGLAKLSTELKSTSSSTGWGARGPYAGYVIDALLDHVRQTAGSQFRNRVSDAVRSERVPQQAEPSSREARVAKKMRLSGKDIGSILETARDSAVSAPVIDVQELDVQELDVQELKRNSPDPVEFAQRLIAQIRPPSPEPLFPGAQGAGVETAADTFKEAATMALITKKVRQSRLTQEEQAEVLVALINSLGKRGRARMTSGVPIGFALPRLSLGIYGMLSVRPDVRRLYTRDAIFEVARPSQGPQCLIATSAKTSRNLGLDAGVSFMPFLRADFFGVADDLEKQGLQGIYLRVERDKRDEEKTLRILGAAVRDLALGGNPDSNLVSNPDSKLLDHLLARHPEVVFSVAEGVKETQTKRVAVGVTARTTPELPVGFQVGGSIFGGKGSGTSRDGDKPGGHPLTVMSTRNLERKVRGVQLGCAVVASNKWLRGTVVHFGGSAQVTDERESISKFVSGRGGAIAEQVQANLEFRSPEEFAAHVLADVGAWVRAEIERHPPPSPADAQPLLEEAAVQANLEAWLSSLRSMPGQDFVYTAHRKLAPGLLPWLDGYKAQAHIAGRVGNKDVKEAAETSITAMLNQPSAWEPFRLVVKIRATGEQSIAFNAFLLAGKTAGAETQGTYQEWTAGKALAARRSGSMPFRVGRDGPT
jgi:hypothetical protein